MNVTLVDNLEWYENMTNFQYCFLFLLPILSFISIVILLRVVWPPKQPRFQVPTSTFSNSQMTSYGSLIPDSRQPSDDIIHAGQIAGAYHENWKVTFDMTFTIAMVAFGLFLVVFTFLEKRELFSNGEFWLYMVPKIGAMMSVSMLGGLICRKFCVVDDLGYVMTTKSSTFKVNYTRKLQHFAAYFIPLALKPGASCHCSGPLELAWGDFVTMIGFWVLIKPLRERCTVLMLQFNSLDRPEDRPHTLKWIIAGNIAPGLVLLLFFRWLFAQTTQSDLVFIIVFITGIGDGLAEPVGITWGKHKYSSRGCFSARKYTRSWEGSACVFLSGMIFPALQYQSFNSFTQLWVTMLVLPPAVAYAEATAPHTMDTPVLMILTGLILYMIVHFV